ncbi:class I SAM-dependent methyltransferase [bacterium]|nr:class I SAM-dependent methyltransferase [bacterium]
MRLSFPNFEKELQRSIHVPQNHPQYKVYLEYGLNRFNYGKELVNHLLLFLKKEEMKVLDIGCGVGGISAAFADDSISIISSELDMNNKNLIKLFFKDLGKNPKLMIADGLELPFKDETFNVVLAIDLIEHVKSLKDFIKELSRVTEENSIVCLTISTRFNWNNIKRDPHYGLFGIILLPRFLRKFIVVKLTKRNPTLDDYTWIRSYKEASKLFKRGGFILRRFSNFFLGLKVPRTILKIGETKDSFYLEIDDNKSDSGWHGCEIHPDYTQRWTKRISRGYIYVPYGAREISFYVSCCNPEITKYPVTCFIKLDKVRIGTICLNDTEWQESSLKIPSKLCNDKLRRFELKVDKTWIPSEVVGTSDSRELGIAVRWIKCL